MQAFFGFSGATMVLPHILILGNVSLRPDTEVTKFFNAKLRYKNYHAQSALSALLCFFAKVL